MHAPTSQKGLTLVEMLVTLAVLGFVLAGIYGLLNSAYQTYLNTRRRIESQQTARAVLDYVGFRLREIDGGKSIADPWNCTQCHDTNRAIFDNATGLIPCPENVSIPRKGLYYTLSTNTLDALTLPDLPTDYATMSGNKIVFLADMLPLHGFSEWFTDADGDGVWEHTDEDGDGVYDYGEGELLEDMNENSELDEYSETWTLELRDTTDKQYYELVETLSFSSLSQQTDASGNLKYNKSAYSDAGYTSEIIADGIVRLNIAEVKKFDTPASMSAHEVTRSCWGTSATACHGSAASGTSNVYNDASAFSYEHFINTHPWWNIRGFSVEVTAVSRKAGRNHFTTFKQFIIPRNMEVNK